MGNFNLKAIRDLNKVTLFYSDGDNAAPKSKMWFYTNQGWSYDFALETGNTLISGVKQVLNNPMAITALNAASGGQVSSVLDIKRKYLFTGSRPLEFSVDCFRVLEESVEKDILEPINELLKNFLPKRGESLGDSAKQVVGTLKEKTNGGEGWDLLNSAIDLVEKFTGDVYYLQVPEQFKVEDRSFTVLLGGKRIKDVFLKSVSIRTPKFVYADADGNPIPDRVDVKLTFETLRVATVDDFKF